MTGSLEEELVGSRNNSNLLWSYLPTWNKLKVFINMDHFQKKAICKYLVMFQKSKSSISFRLHFYSGLRTGTHTYSMEVALKETCRGIFQPHMYLPASPKKGIKGFGFKAASVPCSACVQGSALRQKIHK